LLKEYRISKANEVVAEAKRKLEQVNNDSDDDDLLGWHK
jgi:hypothetical protein